MTETRKPDTSPMRFLEIKNQHEAMRRSGYVGALGFLVTDDLIAMAEALTWRIPPVLTIVPAASGGSAPTDPYKNTAAPTTTMTIAQDGERVSAGAALDTTVPDEFVSRVLSLRRPYGWRGKGSFAVTQAACRIALEFVRYALVRLPGIGLPRAARGGVLLTWRFPELSFSVRVASASASAFQYQLEGPSYERDCGQGSSEQVIARLAAAASRTRR